MKQLSNYLITITLLIVVFSTIFIGCNNTGTPNNSQIQYLDVYNNIIKGNCGIQDCHDSSFEPNFLTAQSTYYTTVMHPSIKNAKEGGFEIRVVPNDTASSLLYERLTNCCFVDTHDQMPLLLDELEPQQLDSISDWIMAGAPDIYGNFPYKNKEK